MNNICIVGNLAREPELQKTQSGASVVRGAVAVDRNFKKEGQQNVDYFDFAAFNSEAEFIAKYARKGDRIEAVGRMESRIVEKDGRKTTYWTLVVERATIRSKQTEQPKEAKEEPKKPIFGTPETDDSLPF